MTAESPGSRRRTHLWLLLSAACFAAIWLFPLPLPGAAHRLLAVFVAVVVLWVSEALPIAATALLIAPAMVITGVCSAKAAFAPYADPILFVFVFVGGFMLAKSMTRHGLDRRLALGILALPMIGNAPVRVRVGLVLTGALLSMWISNVATTAILLPILLGMTPPSDRGGPTDLATTGSLLTVAYGNSIGGLGTPVGSPPNLIAVRFLQDQGIAFTFFDWMSIGIPTVVLVGAMMLFVVHHLAPPQPLAENAVQGPRKPLSRGEKVTALAFSVAILGWMLPGLLRLWAVPGADALARHLPGGAVGLVAATILFVFSDERGERVLPWKDANQIDWGIVMLFGGGLSLGTQMFDSGLAEALSKAFVAASGVSNVWTLTALVTVFTIFFTETCSNTATSNMLVPLVIAVSLEMGVSPVPPVLAVGLAASCAFMLPIATGPNAMVFGTGRVTQSAMMRAGFILNLGAALVIFVLLKLLMPTYGWVD